MVDLDSFILTADDYFRTLGVRYIYCGSISLYLNGINEITEFGDIDIDFIDLQKDEVIKLSKYVVYTYPIDILLPINGIERKYHRIDFYGREFLISDLEYELETKQYLIDNIDKYVYKDKALQRFDLINKYLNKRN